MPNIIDLNGITIQTLTEILNDIVNGNANVQGLKQIYGSDINTDSNSPDGQLINIFALSKQDMLDLIVQLYDSFDPDQAVGTALDRIVALCGIARKGGVYTKVYISMATSQSVSLLGLDTATPYTVADTNGNMYNLVSSTTIAAGTYTLDFQAASMGYIQILANTITVPSTIVLGVSSVTNPTTPYQLGSNQETDAMLRLRRQSSTSLPAVGYLTSLLGGLEQLTGLGYAAVYENYGTATNADGVPAHYMWAIVDGGTDAAVADIIYRYRSAGCGMWGTTSVNVTQVDATLFPIRFDRVLYQNLYITMHLSAISGAPVDATATKAYLAANYLLGIYGLADISSITALIKTFNPDLIVSTCQVSGNNSTWADSVLPTTKNRRFVLTAANITIT